MWSRVLHQVLNCSQQRPEPGTPEEQSCRIVNVHITCATDVQIPTIVIPKRSDLSTGQKPFSRRRPRIHLTAQRDQPPRLVYRQWASHLNSTGFQFSISQYALIPCFFMMALYVSA